MKYVFFLFCIDNGDLYVKSHKAIYPFENPAAIVLQKRKKLYKSVIIKLGNGSEYSERIVLMTVFFCPW